MAGVHTFPLIEALASDIRIPVQYLGDGVTPAARAFELSLLLTWIEENFSGSTSRFSVQSATGVADNGTLSVSTGVLLSKIVVVGSGSGTFSVGTSADGTDVIDNETFDTDGAVYVLEKYFASSGTLYFTVSSGTLTVKLILVDLS